MKRLFKFKYPKLTVLIIAIIAAYYIFSSEKNSFFMSSLNSLSYFGYFIAGLFFSFGFTAPFAVGFFVTAQPESIIIASLISGFGALIADLLIFKLIKFSFMDEFNKLEKTKPIKEVVSLINNKVSCKIKVYLLYVLAGIIIASPLPDEIGVTMLAGLTKIKATIFSLISYLMNTTGILIILLIGSAI